MGHLAQQFFWDYFGSGAPLTIITLAIGTLWLWR